MLHFILATFHCQKRTIIGRGVEGGSLGSVGYQVIETTLRAIKYESRSIQFEVVELTNRRTQRTP
jgi:hypothetical protein